MKFRSIRYYINEAFINLARNRLMALASIATVASCILMLSLSFCIAVNLDEMLKQIQNSVGLTVYIDDELSSEQVGNLYEQIKTLNYIKSVEYISAELALRAFKEELGEDGDIILAGLEEANPLPRSFNIELTDTNYQIGVIRSLELLKSQGITEVRHQQKIVDSLTAINNIIRVISVIIIAVLLITSVVIITNTIKLTVINRKLEINIMKYVGATDAFIRWPFIIEGVLIGFFGSCIPVAICWLTYPSTVDMIYENLHILNGIVFKSATSIFILLLPVAIALGILIGVVGSVTSIRRHLHV